MRNSARKLYDTSSNIRFGHLLESHHWGDSNKYPKHIFCARSTKHIFCATVKQSLSCISLWPLRILYNSKLILMATSFGKNAVVVIVMKTRLYNFDPLKHHFYTVKLGFTGVYIIFLISAQNIDCGYSLEPPRRGGSNEYQQSMFWAEIWKNIRVFLSENFQFLEVKFSIYLNRRVYVMELYFVIPSFGEMKELVALLFVQLLFWLWMTLFFISVVELGYDL